MQTSGYVLSVEVYADAVKIGDAVDMGSGLWEFDWTPAYSECGASVPIHAVINGSVATDSVAIEIYCPFIDFGANIISEYRGEGLLVSGTDVVGIEEANGISANDIGDSGVGFRPEKLSGALAGRDVWQFDGATEYLTKTYTLAQPAFRLLVVRSDRLPPSAAEYLCDGGGGLYGMALARISTDALRLTSGVVLQTAAGVWPGADWAAFELTSNGTSSDVTIDGSSVVSGDAGTNAPAGIVMGARGDLGAHNACTFAYSLDISRLPTAGELTRLRAFIVGSY